MSLRPTASAGLRRLGPTLTAAFLFGTGANLLMLVVPLYSLQVFGRAIPSHNLNTLALLTVVTVLALTIATLLEIVRGRLLTRAGNQLEVALRKPLAAEAAMTRDMGRMNDLTEVKGFLSRPTAAGVLDLPWAPIYAVVIYCIHPQLFGLMAVGALLLFALGLIGNSVGDAGAEARKYGTQSNRFAEVVAGQGGSVRALGMLGGALERWTSSALASSALAASAGDRSAAVAAATRWVRQLLQIGVTCLGAMLVIEQHLSFGGMIATSLLMAKALAPFELVFGGWGGCVKAVRAATRLRKPVQELIVARRMEVATTTGRVVVDNVFFIPPGAPQAALKGATFALDRGECLLVLGPNGAGKSTLARILAGAIRPQGGCARLDGVDTCAPDPERRHPIGYLPEQPLLLPGTIAETIGRFGASEAEITEAAAKVGLAPLVATLPLGYDTDANEALPALGGGGLRRLMLARAICGKPHLLILDEPLASLDVNGLEMLRQILRDAKVSGTTIVVFSHQSSLLELADKVMVLNGGAVAAYGPAEHVVAQAKRDPRPIEATARITR
ncbi:MAG TPA: ATP-binding cassette domain-containing protein [Azospirillaceae bacterium]|nr:ATP-binding cassette domain-containing protein [Azospirillaceae bacterium]